MGSFCSAFLAELNAYCVKQKLIKGAGQPGSTRKTIGRGSIEELDSSYSNGPITHSHGWDTLVLDGISVPFVLYVQVAIMSFISLLDTSDQKDWAKDEPLLQAN